MSSDEVRKVERMMWKALWAVVNRHPSDSNAPEPLALLNYLDNLQQNSVAFPHEVLDLNVAPDSVLGKHHWPRSQPAVAACE
jgi:hypothetical protein